MSLGATRGGPPFGKGASSLTMVRSEMIDQPVTLVWSHHSITSITMAGEKSSFRPSIGVARPSCNRSKILVCLVWLARCEPQSKSAMRITSYRTPDVRPGIRITNLPMSGEMTTYWCRTASWTGILSSPIHRNVFFYLLIYWLEARKSWLIRFSHRNVLPDLSNWTHTSPFVMRWHIASHGTITYRERAWWGTPSKNDLPGQVEQPGMTLSVGPSKTNGPSSAGQDELGAESSLSLSQLVFMLREHSIRLCTRRRVGTGPRESPIQGDRNGDECSGKLYEASGAGGNTAQRLGKYGRRIDTCAKIEAGARIHVSEGMVKDVTVMKYEENG